MKPRFNKKTSSANSYKSLTLKPSSGCTASDFTKEGKHGDFWGATQRSLSMEHINNASKAKDLKLNAVPTYDSNTMISSKTSSSNELLSLSRRKKHTSSSVPSTPVPSSILTREYTQYTNRAANGTVRCHSSNSNHSLTHTKQPSNVLSNIENTLYNGHNGNTTLYTTTKPGGNIYNSSTPSGDSTNYDKCVSSGDTKNEISRYSDPSGDCGNQFDTSAPGGESKNCLDREQAEKRLCKLRQELDRKRIFIKNMKMSLDTVDNSDNIDIRIQHAELEYQLGKEELNLLNILEEFRNLQNSIENNYSNGKGVGGYFHESLSIYNYIVKHCTAADSLSLHAVQVPYDSKCPKFGLSYRDENNGLYVEWTSEEGGGSGLCKGDRILEINNHLIVQTNNRTELIKLLKLLPATKLVVLRKASRTDAPDTTRLVPQRQEDAEKIQSDNVRLTHRISYLEEQVAELLAKVNKGQTFSSSTKLSRTKNKYLETSLCSSEPYETKEYQNQRSDSKHKEAQHLNEEEEEVQVFQKGNKIKTLLKNQKYAKEKLDKVLEKTRKNASCKDTIEDESNNQRYKTEEESTKENRHSLSRKYKTLEKCNPIKYHRRKKSESNILDLNHHSTNGTNMSDTEAYIPKIKSRSLIYLNKSQSDYNYPVVTPVLGNDKSTSSLNIAKDKTERTSSVEKLDNTGDDDRYRKTYTFPIVKYNSDKNVRKVIDAKIYEENPTVVRVDSLESRRSLDRLEDKNKQCFDELNRKLDLCSSEDTKEYRTIVRTENNNVAKSKHDNEKLDLSNETDNSLRKNKYVHDANPELQSNCNKARYNQNDESPHLNNHSYATSRISIEFMDKNPKKFENVRLGANTEPYKNYEPNNNELYQIEKAKFNELSEECINKLDKSNSQRSVLTEQENGSCRTSNGDETEDGDEYGSNQYDEFVRNKQSLDRIYDKYFQEPDMDTLLATKDGKHRYYSKQEILKNKFKNEKYVDIDNDNEIPLSKNVERLNNNFKEFWKIKSYKKNSTYSLGTLNGVASEGIEKSQSETNFNDYERKLINNQSIYPTMHEDVRKFNENTRMSKYELDDKLEKEKLQKSFLSHTRSKPIPPKKPARLSLQRAASLQSVNSIASIMTHNSDSQTKKPIKRNYKGDTTYLTVSLQNTGNERWC